MASQGLRRGVLPVATLRWTLTATGGSGYPLPLAAAGAMRAWSSSRPAPPAPVLLGAGACGSRRTAQHKQMQMQQVMRVLSRARGGYRARREAREQRVQEAREEARHLSSSVGKKPDEEKEKDEGKQQEKRPPAVPSARAGAAPEPAVVPTKQSKWKEMLSRHGPVLVVYWNGVWLTTGVSVYCLLEYGGVDGLELARMIQLDRIVDLDRINPLAGNLAVTIAINEALEVVRLPFTLATVKYVTRWWERVRPAWMVPTPTADGKYPAKPNFADMVRMHGPVFVAWWALLWAVGAGSIFGVLEYHLLGEHVDAIALAHMLHLDQVMDLGSVDPTWGNVGSAVLFNEVLELIRLPFAIATTPKVSRWWRKARGLPLLN